MQISQTTHEAFLVLQTADYSSYMTVENDSVRCLTVSKLLVAPYGIESVAPSDCSAYCVVYNALFTYLQQSHGRCPSHKCSVETPAWIPIQHSTVSLSLLIQRFEGLNGKSLCLEHPWAGKVSIMNAFEKEQ